VSIIKFTPPKDDAPGYLKLVDQAIGFIEQLNGGKPTRQVVKDMVAFLLPFVDEPADRAEAGDAIMDASKVQFKQMMKSVIGDDESNPT
jgi:hypothetical protein